ELENENLLYQKSLEEIVRKKTQALQNSMAGIISLLSDVVEARDPYTAGHQLRVGNLSADIARKMILPQKTVDMVQVIGYIHDIGKIGVPIEILSKPGKLTPLEMQIIREHPTNGYKMLKKVDLPGIIANTIYMHHERCDGTGYPQGLTKDSINIESQIIMVADVVEAMISHRPYRPALGIDAALSEIMQHAGTAYNEEIVSACYSLIYKDHYSLDNDQHDVIFPS
ncbi:MAG: HD domain-containing phosphohydrolase, partial [Eubacteriales bacterium]